MEAMNPDSENILILALTGIVLSGAWLAYKLKLFKLFSTINDEKKILLPSFIFLLSPFLLPFIFNQNMLSESSAINFFLSGTLGSVITGIFLIINTQRISSINNKLQLEREQQQHILQEKSEQQKWYREKIYDSYEKLIHLLTKIMQTRFKIIIKNSNSLAEDEWCNLNGLYNEFMAELTKVIVNHPDENSENFKKIIDEITSRDFLSFLKEDLFYTQIKIILIREKDSRIKG
jgi:hypothetical protein